LRDRNELDAAHGQVALGILIFQDLAIVLLIVLVQVMGETDAGTGGGLLRAAIGLGVLASVVLVVRRLVPAVLKRVVDVPSTDLFTLTISVIGLGAAFVAASVGLSLALGAFLAGLIISESEYGAQALSDVLPFRALFSSIFFTSVGMLLDLGFVTEQAAAVAGAAATVVIGKAVIVGMVVIWVLKRPLFTGVLAGLALAQVGEFSFVLAGVAAGVGLLPEPAYQLFLAATIVSMLLTPLLVTQARPVAEWLVRITGRSAREAARMTETRKATLHDHTIIVGYGMTGRRLARILKAAHLPYAILETNGQVVRVAREQREPIFYGDGTRREVLQKAGVAQAKVVVFNIASPIDERRGVAAARALNPDVSVIVRTRTVDTIADLAAQGASEVVVEEFEAALELFQRVLKHYRIPVNTIQTELDAFRAEHYGILRGVPKDALHLDDLRYLGIHHALQLVEVAEGSPAVGENPMSLHLRSETGATVVAVIRKGEAFYAPDPALSFEVGDAVVLVGPSPSLTRGAALFQKSSENPEAPEGHHA
jgi:CPA2 family monovalent cation:H+ antiporter-2